MRIAKQSALAAPRRRMRLRRREQTAGRRSREGIDGKRRRIFRNGPIGKPPETVGRKA